MTARASAPQPARVPTIPSTIASAPAAVAAETPLVTQLVDTTMPGVTAPGTMTTAAPARAHPTGETPASEPGSPGTAEQAVARPAPERPAPLPAAPAPALPLIAAGITAPAFRLFAQAIHAAQREEERPLAPAPIAAVDQARAPTVVDTPAPLDLGSNRWPQAMIDRIESLRDAASAAADTQSTSIRLVPDALGTIDVSVRSEGDTVHVRFTAEQPATRTLLAEAQPRLTELAEARGIKLAQDHAAGGDVGTGAQSNGQRQPAPQPARPSAPPRAARDDQPETATTRIA